VNYSIWIKFIYKVTAGGCTPPLLRCLTASRLRIFHFMDTGWARARHAKVAKQVRSPQPHVTNGQPQVADGQLMLQMKLIQIE
jgi:hypothetical protein